MASADPSVGSMIAFALDRLGGSSPHRADTGERRTRRDAMARGMLEYVLLDPSARRSFLKQVAGVPGKDAGEFRSSTRTSGTAFDLVASLPHGARVGLVCMVDGDLDPAGITARLEHLGPADGSRLVVITPRSATSRDAADADDPRVVTATWKKLAKRLAEKDSDRSELWRALGELGEDAGPLAVRRPVSPRVLLDETVTAQMRGLLDAMRLASEILFDRPARLAAGRSSQGARLRVGASGANLGLDFGAVEDGSPLWLVGSRPARAFPLGIGALTDEESRSRAEARLRGIASGAAWRSDPSYAPHLGEFIGEPATPAVESARALLWEVLDPRRLAAAGFPPVARRQADLDARRLAIRVSYPADPSAGTFLVSIGGSKTWKTLLPRVTREHDDKTYIVQAKKSDTAQDLVTGVHDALRSLATKP